MNDENDKKFQPNLLFDVLLNESDKYFKEMHFTKSIRSLSKATFFFNYLSISAWTKYKYIIKIIITKGVKNKSWS